MPERLVPFSPTSKLPTISLQRPVLLVGRHVDADVRIDLPQVSRRHCCLALAYDRLLIRDLGSRNGVRVNGRLVDEARLQPGDEIAIAHLLYRLEDSDSARLERPNTSAPSAAPITPPELPADPDSDDIELIPLDDE